MLFLLLLLLCVNPIYVMDNYYTYYVEKVLVSPDPNLLQVDHKGSVTACYLQRKTFRLV